MKKVLLKSMLLVEIITSILLVGSSAFAKNVYYTNNNGVEMTELQYNKMLQIFSEKRLSDISQKEFDKYKDANVISNDAVYQKVTFKDNKLVSEEYISEAEFEAAPESEVSSGISPQDSDSHFYETSYKKLAAAMLDTNGTFDFVGALTWKKVPKTRSYDVFAYRFTHFDYTGFVGSQYYYTDDGVYSIEYDASSPGYKAQSNGAGVSMNLKDGVNITGYELSVGTTMYINTSNYSQAHAYITYQHAQSDLTREQSMSYTLDISGLGNVVYFSDTSIRNKYDEMAGLHLTTPI